MDPAAFRISKGKNGNTFRQRCFYEIAGNYDRPGGPYPTGGAGGGCGPDAGPVQYWRAAGVRLRWKPEGTGDRPGYCDPLPGSGAGPGENPGFPGHDCPGGDGKAGYGGQSGLPPHGPGAGPAAAHCGKRQTLRYGEPGGSGRARGNRH